MRILYICSNSGLAFTNTCNLLLATAHIHLLCLAGVQDGVLTVGQPRDGAVAVPGVAAHSQFLQIFQRLHYFVLSAKHYFKLKQSSISKDPTTISEQQHKVSVKSPALIIHTFRFYARLLTFTIFPLCDRIIQGT